MKPTNNRKFNPLPLDKEYGIHRSLLSDPKTDKDNNLDLGKFIDYRIDQRVEPPADSVTDEHILDVVNAGIADETITIPSSLPYKVFIGKVYSLGGSNTVVTLENTLGATLTATVPSNGLVVLNPSADVFVTSSKVWISVTNYTGANGYIAGGRLASSFVTSLNATVLCPHIDLMLHDGSQSGTPSYSSVNNAINVEIRIYP